MGEGYRLPGPAAPVEMEIGAVLAAEIFRSTRRSRVVEVLAPSASVTVRVIVAVPDRMPSGRIVIVRLEPLPPSEMLAFGTRFGGDEVAVAARVRLPAGGS